MLENGFFLLFIADYCKCTVMLYERDRDGTKKVGGIF